MLSFLTFAHLSFALAGLMIPLLVLAYLRKRKDQSLIVPSLLIVRNLARKKVSEARLKLPPRFFLEVLILLLLVLAAMVPSLDHDSRTIAIVIDTSLSMSATDSSGTSRLDLAKQGVSDFLENLSSEKDVRLFVSAPEFRSVEDRLLSPGAALSRLSLVKAATCSDRLVSDITTLAETGKYQEVVLFTDKQVDSGDGNAGQDGQALGSSSASSSSGSKTTLPVLINYTSVGQALDNYYVADFRRLESSLSDREILFEVMVGWSGIGVINLQAELYQIPDGTRVAVARAVKELVVRSGDDGKATFSISKDIAKETADDIWEIRLVYKEGSGKFARNAISADDRAWVGALGEAQTKVLAISPLYADNSSLPGEASRLSVDQARDALGLSSIANIQFAKLSPENYEKLDRSRYRDYRFALFHLSAPKSKLPIPVVMVLPPDVNPYFPVERVVEQATISSWQEAHPFNNYLKVPLLPVSKVLIFQEEPWVQPVIRSEDGPIVVAGMSDGQAIAAVGFEIFPFEKDRTPLQSVLTLNLFNWLLRGAAITGDLLSGSSYVWGGSESATIISPEGERKELLAQNRSELVLDSPGIYRLEGAQGGPRHLLANPLHVTESNTSTASRLNLPRLVQATQGGADEKKPLWPLLLQIALGLLLIDWLVALFGRKKNV